MFSLIFSLLIAAESPEAAAPQPTGETTATPAKEKLVCRRVQPSNSRLAKRECRTQKEWNEAADSVGSKVDSHRGN